MSQLIYSPFGALNQLHRELNRVFDDRGSSDEPTFFEAGNVDITLERNVLTIRGSRTNESETSNKDFKRRERVSGTFVRQFALPDSADGDAISAKMTNGVLEVVIPKGEKHKPRTITVQ